MIGRWDLRPSELIEWQSKARQYTEKIRKEKEFLVNLTGEDITPYQVGQVLESLEWKWEKFVTTPDGNDVWNIYKRKGNKDIVVYVNTLTFELAVYLLENVNNWEFKAKHAHSMIGG